MSRNVHIHRDSPQKTRKQQRLQAVGAVSRDGLWDSSESLAFVVFWDCLEGYAHLVAYGTVGQSRKMAFGIAQNLCVFFFWDCLDMSR